MKTKATSKNITNYHFKPISSLWTLAFLSLFISCPDTTDPTPDTSTDTTPPTLSQASVDGSALTLAFSEDLDEVHNPGPSAFSIVAGTSNPSVSSVAINEATVTLALGSEVVSEQTVRLWYTPPSQVSNRLQDEEGNPVPGISGRPVTNVTPDTSTDTTPQPFPRRA